MPKKKELSLSEVVASLMTLDEATEWIEAHKEEYGLARVPNTDTLKKACYHKRLNAVLKGRLYLTRETELREYIKQFDPKNKTESKPVTPRTLQRRATKEKAKASKNA